MGLVLCYLGVFNTFLIIGGISLILGYVCAKIKT